MALRQCLKFTDINIPLYVPKLYDFFIITVAIFRVTNGPRQVTKAILMSFGFLFHHVLILEASFVLEDVDYLFVINDFSIISFIHFKLVRGEHLLDLFMITIWLRIFGEEHGESQSFESIYVLTVGLLLLKFIYLILFLETVVM